MPLYCYETADKEVMERMFRMGEAPKQIVLADGRIAKRSLVAELKGQASPSAKNWPLTCVASGVHPDQAGELRQTLAKAGVPTEVTKDGDPVYRSASHRRKALKARGLHDRASFC